MDVKTDEKEVSVKEQTVIIKSKDTEPEKKKIQKEPVTMVEQTLSQDEVTLQAFIEEYLNYIQLKTPSSLQASLSIAIQMVRFLIKNNNMNLYKYVFEKLFRSESKNIIVPEVVFQYLHMNKDSDKVKVEALYSTMVALDRHLKRPKKMGFPLDLNQVTIQFGNDGLANFVKTYLR